MSVTPYEITRSLDTFVSLGIAKETITMSMYNNSGSQINKGECVYIVSWNTTESKYNIALADNSNDSSSSVIGIATENISNGSAGTIHIQGELDPTDIYTVNNGVSNRKPLYLADDGTVTDDLTSITDNIVNIGYVVYNDIDNIKVYVSGSYQLSLDGIDNALSGGGSLWELGGGNEIYYENEVIIGDTSLTAGYMLDVNGDVLVREDLDVNGAFNAKGGATIYASQALTQQTHLTIGYLQASFDIDTEDDPYDHFIIKSYRYSPSYIWQRNSAGGYKDYMILAGGLNPYLDLIDDTPTTLIRLHTGGYSFINTGNNFGIGTTTPDYLLDVAGTMGVDDYIYHNGDADTYLRFLPDEISIYAGNIFMIHMYEGTQDYIYFNENGNDVDFLFNYSGGDAISIAGDTGLVTIGEDLTVDGNIIDASFSSSVNFNSLPLKNAIIWHNPYDTDSALNIMMPGFGDLAYHAVERGWTVTPSRAIASGSLSDMFNLTWGSANWTGVNSTPVQLDITPTSEMYIDTIEIVFGSRNCNAIDYTIEVYEDNNDDTIYQWTTIANVTGNDSYFLQHSIGMWRVETVRITVTDAGDADQDGNLRIATIQLKSGYDYGQDTGYIASKGSNAFYGNQTITGTTQIVSTSSTALQLSYDTSGSYDVRLYPSSSGYFYIRPDSGRIYHYSQHNYFTDGVNSAGIYVYDYSGATTINSTFTASSLVLKENTTGATVVALSGTTQSTIYGQLFQVRRSQYETGISLRNQDGTAAHRSPNLNFYSGGGNNSYIRNSDTTIEFIPTTGGASELTIQDDGILINEYIYHYGDTDTWTRFQNDAWAMQVGGWKTIEALNDNLTLSPENDLILKPESNEVLPYSTYSVNLGSETKKYLSLHVAEIVASQLTTQYVRATIGGRIIVSPSSVLSRDFDNTENTYIYLKHDSYDVNEFLWLESVQTGTPQYEIIRLLTGPTLQAEGDYRYTIDSRNLDGTGANDWLAGDSITSLGGFTGDGWIDIYSQSSGLGGSQTGPTMVGFFRWGEAAYTSYDEIWAIGNLDGYYGYSSKTYGVAIGRYTGSNDTYSEFMATEISMYSNGTEVFNVSSGTLTVNSIDVESGTIGGLSVNSNSLSFDDFTLANNYAGNYPYFQFGSATGGNLQADPDDWSGAGIWIGQFDTSDYAIFIGDVSADEFLYYTTSSGFVLQGGIIRTSSSGNRIELENDTLTFIGTSGSFSFEPSTVAGDYGHATGDILWGDVGVNLGVAIGDSGMLGWSNSTTYNGYILVYQYLQFQNAGTQTIKITGSNGEITFGTDTNLYRESGNLLKTDDSFEVAGAIVNDSLVKAVVTDDGMTDEVEITVNIKDYKEVAASGNDREMATIWFSHTEYGAPEQLAGTIGVYVTSLTNGTSLDGTITNIAKAWKVMTDSNHQIVLTVNENAGHTSGVTKNSYLMIEVQGIIYSHLFEIDNNV